MILTVKDDHKTNHAACADLVHIICLAINTCLLMVKRLRRIDIHIGLRENSTLR